MKFNFWGYDTKTMMDLGLDGNDLMFIQWFRDFRDSGKMESIETENGTGYYVGYSKVIEDIPPLFKSSIGVTDEVELKKIEATNKKKIFNMLKGNLSKVFTRLEKKEQGKTKIYLSLNADVFTALVNNGNDFDAKIIDINSKVVKLNAPKKKKAPKTGRTVKDANNEFSKDSNNSEVNIPYNSDNVKSKNENNKNKIIIGADVTPDEIDVNADDVDTGVDVTVNDINSNTSTSDGDVNVDDLNMNAYYLFENGIKVANWTAVNKLVANWSGLILGEAIETTLASAINPNFNYVKKTYESIIATGGGIEAVEKRLLAPLLGY